MPLYCPVSECGKRVASKRNLERHLAFSHGQTNHPATVTRSRSHSRVRVVEPEYVETVARVPTQAPMILAEPIHPVLSIMSRPALPSYLCPMCRDSGFSSASTPCTYCEKGTRLLAFINRDTNKARTEIVVPLPVTFSGIGWLPVIGIVTAAGFLAWKYFKSKQPITFLEEAVETFWAKW